MKALRRIIYSWSLLVITFSALAGDLVVTAHTPNGSVCAELADYFRRNCIIWNKNPFFF